MDRDKEDGSCSSSSLALKTTQPESAPILQSRTCSVISQFTQQTLPACKPILTPVWVISTFLLICVLFVPVGLFTLGASRSVVEIVDRYDIECIPPAFQRDKVAYIRHKLTPKNCTRFFKVQKTMTAPIYIYYQLDRYYQNHRRYVKSRSDQQLLHGIKYKDTSTCKPEEYNNGLPIVPCGLIAWSLFNDTYTFTRGSQELNVNKKNISWKSDREHKFGKGVYPFNFQNGSFIGGGKLDQNVALSNQEDLIVWMRTSALPSFRKLYGIIEEDLNQDDLIEVSLMNNYNTYSFGGKKMLVLSTANWLGGRNDFLGLAYLAIGFSSLVISLLFTVLHIKYPRHIQSRPASVELDQISANIRERGLNMAKQLRHMHRLREVAPALITYPQKSSSCPNLETIFEEAESMDYYKNSKWVLAVLPLIISMLSYALMSRNLISLSR